MELKETFMDGIDIINRIQPHYVTDADKLTKIKLQNAVDSIGKRIEFLANFGDGTDYYSHLAKEVRAAGIHRAPALGGSDVKPEETNQEGNSTDQSDPSIYS